jgi:hypothetical protein
VGRRKRLVMTLKWEQMTRQIRYYCVTSKFEVFGCQEPCLHTYTMPEVISRKNPMSDATSKEFWEILFRGKLQNLTILGSGI